MKIGLARASCEVVTCCRCYLLHGRRYLMRRARMLIAQKLSDEHVHAVEKG